MNYADPEKVKAVEFSEAAREMAKAMIDDEDRSSEAYFRYVEPYFKSDDMKNLFLITKVFMRTGGKLPLLARFAREHRSDDYFGPILDWCKVKLLEPGGVSDEDRTVWDAAAEVWVQENLTG